MKFHYNKETFTVDFPSCFDGLKGDDANFEMVASNTIQPLRLPYSFNVVTKSEAVIFLNTHTGGQLHELPYRLAAVRAGMHRDLFTDILKFDKVSVLENLSKDEIIAKIKVLKQTSDDFEKAGNGIYSIAIVNVGYYLNLKTYKRLIDLAERWNYKAVEDAEDGTTFSKYYSLTTEGEPIALSEYGYDIAANEKTHVVQLYDFDSSWG